MKAEAEPAQREILTSRQAAERYWPNIYGGPVKDARMAFEAGAAWAAGAITPAPFTRITHTERLVAEHPRWKRRLQRAKVTDPEIKSIVHFRHPNAAIAPSVHYTHVAVVVLANGACYWSQATFPNHPYDRRLQRLRAVGRALKRTAMAMIWGGDPDFRIDSEYEGRDLYKAVRGALAYGALGAS